MFIHQPNVDVEKVVLLSDQHHIHERFSLIQVEYSVRQANSLSQHRQKQLKMFQQSNFVRLFNRLKYSKEFTIDERKLTQSFLYLLSCVLFRYSFILFFSLSLHSATLCCSVFFSPISIITNIVFVDRLAFRNIHM